MIKEYVCKFEVFGKKEELVFEIIDNPLTRDWSRLVEYYFDKGEKYPLQIVNDYGENKELIFQEMLKITKLIGLEYNYTFSNYTRESLNRLHEEFHFKEEQNVYNKDLELYHRLNILIHKLERNNSIVSWHTHKELDKIIPIKDEHWPYFDIKDKVEITTVPSISLGYFTIGKDLKSCLVDNDVELVKKSGVRPIQRLHTQIIYHSSTTLFNRKKDIRRWAKENKISHLIDWSNPQYSMNQRNPLLGKLKKGTQSKADMLWTYWSFKEIDIH